MADPLTLPQTRTPLESECIGTSYRPWRPAAGSHWGLPWVRQSIYPLQIMAAASGKTRSSHSSPGPPPPGVRRPCQPALLRVWAPTVRAPGDRKSVAVPAEHLQDGGSWDQGGTCSLQLEKRLPSPYKKSLRSSVFQNFPVVPPDCVAPHLPMSTEYCSCCAFFLVVFFDGLSSPTYAQTEKSGPIIGCYQATPIAYPLPAIGNTTPLHSSNPRMIPRGTGSRDGCHGGCDL